MKEPVWLDRADTLAIHEMVLALHGGLGGVRDEGLLESALAKPRQLSHDGSPTLADLAGSHAADVILHHPFLDGNKRTGFLLAATFLELNPKSEIKMAEMSQDVGAEMNRKIRSHTQSGLARLFQFIYAQQIAADRPF